MSDRPEFDTTTWESAFLKSLGMSVVFGIVIDESVDPLELSAGERIAFEELFGRRRQESWIRGRKALKAVLRRLRESEDTTGIEFPNPRFSISHSGALGVAVGLRPTSIQGVGVDVEIDRCPPVEGERFFLTRRESEWLHSLQEIDRPPLRRRLWTQKEALYKADPTNEFRRLTDYELEDPARPAGKARASERRFLYASQDLPGGVVSVAVLPFMTFKEAFNHDACFSFPHGCFASGRRIR